MQLLSEEQKAHFDTLGYLVLPGLLGAKEVELYTEVYEKVYHDVRGGADFSPAWAKQRPGASGIRQQLIPFFNMDERFLDLLDHPTLNDLVEDLLGEDCLLMAAGEGFAAATDSIWHTDSRAPAGFNSLKVGMYLDEVDADTGCLNVIPASCHPDYNAAIRMALDSGMFGGVKNQDIPMRKPLPSKPGDVIVFNHRTYHSSFGGKMGRRAIMCNWCQSPTEGWHTTWILGQLTQARKEWGVVYGERVIATAGERRKKKLERVLAMGLS